MKKVMKMSDIEIAKACVKKPIIEIASDLGLEEDQIELLMINCSLN